MINPFNIKKRFYEIVESLAKKDKNDFYYNNLKTQLDLIEYKIDNIQKEKYLTMGFVKKEYAFNLRSSYFVNCIIDEQEEIYKSYSQYKEDLVIKYIFDKVGIENPTYIDIGAHDPFHLSNTALLYESGCRGINIEPNPDLFKKFKIERQNDINLNIGVYLESGNLDYFIFDEYPAYNTFSSEQIERLKKVNVFADNVVKVEVKHIDEIIKNYSNDIFPDFLSIDVEGFDYQILSSIDYSKDSPKLICVEINFHGVGGRNILIDQLLYANGYFVYANVGGNTLFVKNEYLEKLAV